VEEPHRSAAIRHPRDGDSIRLNSGKKVEKSLSVAA
jgi:hypothetical protein